MKMTIGRKIALPFFVMFILIVGVAGITYQGFKKITALNESIEFEDMKRDIAGNLRFNITQLLMPANDYIITQKHYYMREFDRLNLVVNIIIQKFNQLSLTDEEQRLLVLIKQDLDSIRTYSAQIFSISSPRKSPKASALMETMDYRFGEEVNKKTTQIFDGISERDKEFVQQTIGIKENVTNTIFGITFLSIFVSLVVTFVAVRKISRPIITVAKVADSIANGDYSKRAVVKTNDEVAFLANSFNVMAESIQKSQSALVESKRLTETIVETVPIGLLVFCKNGIIKSVNNSFCNIFNFRQNELLEQNITKFVDELKIPDECRSNILNRQPVSDVECTYSDPIKGKRILSLTLFSIMSDEGEILLFVEDITNRKHDEQIVINSEKRFRTLIENSTDGLAIINAEGILIYESLVNAKITGYEPGELISQNAFSLIHQDDYPMVMGLFKEILKTPSKIISAEFRIRLKNGMMRWVEATATNLMEDIMVGGIVVNFRNITERRLADETLRKSEERYRTLIEHASDGIFIADASGKYIEVNTSGCIMLGYTRDEILQKTIQDLTKISSDKPLRIEELRQGKKIVSERELICKDGSLVPVEISAKLLPDGNLQGIVRDVSERKHAAEKLLESEERSKLILEKAMDAVISIDVTGCVVEWNTEAERIFGYPRDEVLGLRMSDLIIPPSYREAHTKGMERYLQSGESKILDKRIEITAMRRDGTEFPAELNISVVHRKEEIFFSAFLRDISERKRSELLQNAVYQISQTADKIVTLDDLYKSVHEIISTIMPSKNFYISLYDEVKNLLSFPYFVDEIDPPSPPTKFGKGLTEYVLRTCKPLLCDEATDKELREKGEVELVGEPSAVWLGVPLIVSDKIIGVMVVQHYSNPKAYGERELQMLEYVSSQVARTIERKRVEEKLLESEGSQRMIMDSIDEVIYSTEQVAPNSPEGIARFVSTRAEKLFGYKPDEFIQNPNLWLSLIHPDDVFAVIEQTNTLFNTKQNGVRQYRILNKQTGEYIWMEDTVVLNLDNENNVIGTFGVGRNITERKRAEEEFRKLAAIIEQTADSVYLTDRNGIIQYVNPAFTKINGYSKDEALGKTPRIFKSGLHPPQFYEALWKTILSGEVFRATFVNKRKDGELFYVIKTITPIKDEKGNITNFVATAKEITEQRRAEEALRNKEEHHKAVIENIFKFIPEGVLVLTESLNLLKQNKTFDDIVQKYAPLLGYTEQELAQKIIEQLCSKIVNGDSKEIHIGKKDQLETGISGRDELIIQFNTSRMFLAEEEEEEANIVVSLLDITDRKLAEETIQQSEQKYRGIFESIQDVYFETTLDGTILELSPSIESLTKGQYKRDDLIGKLIQDYYVDPQARLQLIFELKKHKSILDYEITLKNRDGSSLECSISAIFQFDSSGRPEKIIGTMHDITDRKLAEKTLRESEIKFRKLISSLPDAVLVVNTEGRIVYCNENATKIFGYNSVDEILSCTMEDLIPKRFRKGHIAFHHVYYSEPKSRAMGEGKELFALRKDGSEFPTEIMLEPVEIDNKLHVLTVVHDVTERKRTEKEILMLANSLRSVNECVSITNLEDKLLFVNESFIKTYGYSEEELIGKNIHIVRSSNTPPEIAREILPATLSGGWHGELWNKRKDGSEFPIYLSTTVISDKDGKPLGLIGVARDITDRKKAEEEIISQKNRFAQLYENSPYPIAILDAQHKIIQINESFTSLFGYYPEEITRYSVDDLLVPSELKEEAKIYSNETQKGNTINKESYRKKKDGTLVSVQILGVPIIINEKVVGVYAVYIDLTQRKESEDKMKVAKELAEQSDRLKSEFLAQMSHEIRTPINIMAGNVDYLKDLFGEKMDTEAAGCFDGIDLASKRIIRTIDLILNVAVLQTSGYKPLIKQVDLNSDILNKLYQEHQLSAKQKGLELIYKCELKAAKTLADEYSITQIFANLIDNAIKYTKKGKVEILLGKNKKGKTMVEIKDTGIGMSKEYQSKMFEPFIQEDHGFSRTYDGSGLGLALTKKYCEINNAVIEVESKKNVGSTFRVIFK